MVKVLYVAAWGRSGTTIVDNILNGYPGVFSAGELSYLWRRGLLRRRSCGCAQPVPACPVWTRILAAAFGSRRPDPRRVVKLQRRATRARSTHSLLHGAWPPEAVEYADLMSRLYQAIHEVTGAELIVDSSKLPSEAAILTRLPDLEAYLLHMVRDPRAVAYSWSRRKMHRDVAAPMAQHTSAKSTVNWLAWNGLTELAATHYPGRYRRLRYEDLVTDPQGQIESLLELVGVSSADGPFLDRARVRLARNHTVSGNPGRFRVGDIDIRDDDSWRAEQAMGPRLMASALALPLAVRYRYPLWPRRRGPATVVVRPRTAPAGAGAGAPVPTQRVVGDAAGRDVAERDGAERDGVEPDGVDRDGTGQDAGLGGDPTQR